MSLSAALPDESLVRVRVAERRHEFGQSFSPEVLREIARREGIDFATALLYDKVWHCDRNGPLIRAIDALQAGDQRERLEARATVAVAPGAFYQEFPHTGADGRLLLEQAERLGFRTAVIPSRSMGTLAENARIICDWLQRQSGEPLVLVSVSKGGSDIKTALSLPGADEAFQHVHGWINVCGILEGSPMVNWLLESKVRQAFYRSLFWWRGYDFEVLRQLRHGPDGLLSFPLTLPEHLHAVHLIGFPLVEHLSNRLARKCHARLSPLGPNDGAVMLADLLPLPGQIYPVWGGDHYLRPSWQLRRLARALLVHLGQELHLFEPAGCQGSAS